MPVTPFAAAAFIVLALSLPGGSARAIDFDEPSRTDLIVTVERSQGNYGEAEKATLLSIPITLRHRTGRWTGQVEVPFVQSDSFEQVLPGIGAVGGPTARRRVSESGIGDVWLKLTYELKEFRRDALGIDTTLKVKLATGDFDKGLGTGGTDVALQVEFFRALGPLTSFGHVGYRKTGDVAGFTPYKDPAYGELGLFGKVDGCDLGGFHTYRQPIGSLGPVSETTVYLACSSGLQRTQVYVARGFRPASADIALGLSYRYRF